MRDATGRLVQTADKKRATLERSACTVFLSAGACRASLGTFPAVCRGLWRLGVDDATLDAVMAHDNRRGAPTRRYSGDHRCHRRSTLQHSPACLDCHALLAVPSREGFGQQCSAISAHPQRDSCACMWRRAREAGQRAVGITRVMNCRAQSCSRWSSRPCRACGGGSEPRGVQQHRITHAVPKRGVPSMPSGSYSVFMTWWSLTLYQTADSL